MQLYRPIALAIVAIAAECACVQEPSRPGWGAPAVVVSKEGMFWTIRGQKQIVTLNEADLALRVAAGDATWEMVPSEKDDMLVKADGTQSSCGWPLLVESRSNPTKPASNRESRLRFPIGPH